MEIEVVNSLKHISPAEWNNLTGKLCPFIRYEFLSALETQGCLGAELGWIPAHFIIREDNELAAAMPAYVKTNSYGELVFDWTWADAYQRAGMPYYPKLVTAVPYTPATGRRLFVAPGRDQGLYQRALLQAMRGFVEEHRLSSYHCLFPDQDELEVLREQGLMLRQACQFHWINEGYQDFSSFLSSFASRKRKKVLRERRKVEEAGIQIELLSGSELGHEHWAQLYPFYRDTFLYKGGIPTLTQGFFEQVSQTMGDQLLVIAARCHNEYVAAAIFFRGADTLYGRHWGCNQKFSGLHFELCYYQGIEYAIAHGLKRFEPGAQGEYKVSRGFRPTTTWSAHWIVDEQFRSAIHGALKREDAYMQEYAATLEDELPFKKGDT